MSKNDIDKELKSRYDDFLDWYSKKGEHPETHKLKLKSFFDLLQKKVEKYKEENFQPLGMQNGNCVNVAHYTSMGTVYTILSGLADLNTCKVKAEEVGLRLYAASDMNDPKEGEFLKDQLARICPWVADAEKADDIEAFICSFVSSSKDEVANNITYWQAYGEDGFGCSIQPDDALKQKLFRVKYGDGNDGTGDVIARFRETFNICNKDFNIMHPHDREKFANEFWKCFYPIKFLYKHNGYAKEEECRYIEYAGSNRAVSCHISESGGNSIVRSYITVNDLMAENILATSNSKIYMGPRVPNPETAKKRFKELLEKYKPSGELTDKPDKKLRVALVASKIPYRGNL